MDVASVVTLVSLGLAALLSVHAVVGYLRAGHDRGTTMGEEMAFGQGWGLSAIFLGVGLLGSVPWWAAGAAVVAWYLLSLPLRSTLGRLALVLGTPESGEDGDDSARPGPKLPG